MTETKQTSTTKTDRRPDCVTEIRMGNSVLKMCIRDSRYCVQSAGKHAGDGKENR